MLSADRSYIICKIAAWLPESTSGGSISSEKEETAAATISLSERACAVDSRGMSSSGSAVTSGSSKGSSLSFAMMNGPVMMQ